jgi:hypothetical protein
MLRLGIAGLVLTIALASGPIPAHAAILGAVDVLGEAEITFATTDWTPFLPGDPYNGTGDVVVAAPAAGIFAPLATADIGTIVDRDAVGATVPPQPVGVPILVPNWLTFAALPGIALDLTFIIPGTFPAAECGPPAAIGDTCTPPAPAPFISPYNFSNFLDLAGGLSSNANFSVSGNVRDTATDALIGTFDGIFGIEFFGTPLETVLAETFTGGAGVVGSFGGTIVATGVIPEPSTPLLMLAGAVVITVKRFTGRGAGLARKSDASSSEEKSRCLDS